jgi:hypothetical protein
MKIVKRVSKYSSVRGIDRFDVKELFNSNLHMNLFFKDANGDYGIEDVFVSLYNA